MSLFMFDYQVSPVGDNFNSYSYNFDLSDPYIDEYSGLDCLDISMYPKVENKYLEIIRQIDNFTLLRDNWDGFKAIPLSNYVAEKAKIIVENLNLDFFENKDFEIKPTPYSTLVIDWYNNENEFSLEVGKSYLGYYCDGVISKEVDQIEISSIDQITNAINQIERDLRKILY